MKRASIFVLCLIFLCATTVIAQDPPTPTPNPESGPATQAPGGAGPSLGGFQQNQDPRPYDRVITKDAKTKTGVFTVHQVKNNWYYEIPKSELGKEFLWANQIAKTTFGQGYGGQFMGSRVVRWERNGNRIFLRNVNYHQGSDTPATLDYKRMAGVVDGLEAAIRSL